MRLSLLCTLAAVALSQALTYSDGDEAEWELFKTEYEKEYEDETEENKRKAIFMENLNFIREHNKKFEEGEETFTVGVNKFADLTNKEFREMVNGLRIPEGYKSSGKPFELSEDVELPKAVDWRKKGAVTGVKDQGKCQSDWAFSTTGTLEGLTFLKTKKLVSLSEQNLVDCSKPEGNFGCEGGMPDFAYGYIKKNGGIDTEESYPYKGKEGKCHYKPADKGATDSNYVVISDGNEETLQKAVATVGPIAAGIDASSKAFQLYKKGVYKDKKCQSEILEHGVLVAGYGSAKKGGDYWLVKNCWGTSWGMKGYILMARNNHNMCGIASFASYPVVP